MKKLKGTKHEVQFFFSHRSGANVANMNHPLFLCFFAFCFWSVCRTSGKVHRHPVIYIPGDGGSRIEAIIDKEKVMRYLLGFYGDYHISRTGKVLILSTSVIDMRFSGT